MWGGPGGDGSWGGGSGASETGAGATTVTVGAGEGWGVSGTSGGLVEPTRGGSGGEWGWWIGSGDGGGR